MNRYGSRVYGSARPDSDEDWIVVDPDQQEEVLQRHHEGAADVTSYSLAEFQRMIHAHEVGALECLLLPPEHILQQDHQFDWVLDPEALRRSFAAKASHAWVKARKKLAVEHELRLAQKSLFHALRILHYGIQIASTGRVTDWGVANPYLAEVEALAPEWSVWDAAFRERNNALRTEFRRSAPLDPNK